LQIVIHHPAILIAGVETAQHDKPAAGPLRLKLLKQNSWKTSTDENQRGSGRAVIFMLVPERVLASGRRSAKKFAHATWCAAADPGLSFREYFVVHERRFQNAAAQH
jgi:hypothetical protein